MNKKIRWSFYFVFTSSLGPGYVWHCHILEHAGIEMMRSV
ncbi:MULTISPECIES: multicopper oxidase domain-containing protein [Metabacillus]|nr:multicopper oxidase domain-containing protein [Metabacillus dongyingensis]USK27245.1 multicopper oxidase domain-containing protein [Bacillus sp. CMF21]